MTDKKNSVYDQALQQFIFKGDKKDILRLQELIGMVASVPTGREILEGIIVRGKPVTLLFVSELKNSAGLSVNGQYFWADNSVSLLRPNQDESKMSPEEAVRSKIMQVRILAHELQHSADGSINKWLDLHAANIDESVLVNVLAEAHALMNESQFVRELTAQLEMTQGKEVTDSAEPYPPERLKRATERAFSGNSPMFKAYMNRMRRLVSRRKYRERDFQTTVAFRTNVENYLKNMRVDMSFDEAMRYVKQSIKLLPAAKVQSTKPSR